MHSDQDGVSSAESVISDLQSGSTTSPKTLRLLRALLGLQLDTEIHHDLPRRGQDEYALSKTIKTTNRTTTTKRARATVILSKTPTSGSHEHLRVAVAPLTCAAKNRLAITSFNACLQKLTEAAKKKQAQSRSGQAASVAPSSPRKQSKGTLSSPTGDHSKHGNEDVNLVAECAASALDSLHSNRATVKEGKGTDISNHDQGDLVLLDKCITLGLVDLALTRVAKTHRRIWQDESRKSDQVKPAGASERHPLAGFVAVKSRSESKLELSFVSSYHTQILRLAIVSGPSVLNQAFVTSIQYTETGSPANVVAQAHQLGFLSVEKAGLQLRTIYQALLKVYSSHVAVKSSIVDAELAFLLLNQALDIKCRSWHLLQYKPDLNTELWQLFLRGCKQLAQRRAANFPRIYATVTKAIDHLKKLLASLTYNTTLPQELRSYVTDIAEQCGHFEEVLNILGPQQSNSPADAIEQVIETWRRAVLKQKVQGVMDETLLEQLKSAHEQFRMDISWDFEKYPKLQLYLVRLRKSVSSIIAQTHSEVKLLKCYMDLQTTCVDILRATAQLAHATLPKLDERDDAIKKPKTTTENSITILAKAIEAVLDAESCSSQHELLSSKVESALHECSIFVDSLLNALRSFVSDNEPLANFVYGVTVRFSNVLWRRYVISSSSPVDSIVTYLSNSVKALSTLPIDVQVRGALGTKLEKLAVTHLQMKNVDFARQTFEKAIVHFLHAGGLETDDDASPVGDMTTFWSRQGPVRCSLGASLKSFVKISLTYELSSHATHSWIFEDPSLKFWQRCALLQKQIHASADHVFNDLQAESVMAAITKTLGECLERPMLCHKLHFALSLLQIRSIHTAFPALSAEVEQFFKQLTSIEQAQDVMETAQDSVAWLMHTIAVSWCLQQTPVEVESLRAHADAICAIVLRCQGAQSFKVVIDNVEFCRKQLHTLVSFFRMVDDVNMQIRCALALEHILKNQGHSLMEQVDVKRQLGSLYSRTGVLAQAEIYFVAIREHLVDDADADFVMVRSYLAYAEHLSIYKDLAKTEQVFQQALTIFNNTASGDEHLSGRRRLERDSVLVEASRLASRMAFLRGNSEEASRYARQAVKLSSGIWQAVENSQTGKNKEVDTSINEISLNYLTQNMSGLTLSTQPASVPTTIKGAVYWDYVDGHSAALSNMSVVSLHAGLYQDALYYVEQLNRLAQATGSEARIRRAQCSLALLHAKADHAEKALSILPPLNFDREVMPTIEDYEMFFSGIQSYIEFSQFDQAQSLLDALTAANVHSTNLVTPAAASLSAQNTIQKRPVRGRAKAARTIKAPAKHPSLKTTATSLPTNSVQPVTLKNRVDTQLLALQSQLDVHSHKDQSGSSCPNLSTSQELAAQPLSHRVNVAMLMLNEALRELSSDAVKCVLAETAVALPVRYKSTRKGGRVSSLLMSDVSTTRKVQKSDTNKHQSTNLTTAPGLSAGDQLLLDSYNLFLEVQKIDACYMSSELLHLISKMQSKLALLTSILGASFHRTSIDIVLQSLMSKDMVYLRECLSSRAEQHTRTKEQVLTWPQVCAGSKDEGAQGQEVLRYAMTDLEDIPTCWSLVSISLAEDQKELLVSKISAGRSPFLLRIPLSRTDELQDEGDFSFIEAKSELVDIVTEANASCHDARGQGNKQTRRAWYTERETIDQRLGALLANIETIWLGGFRGLMTSQPCNKELLAKFGETLSRTLDTHLPSRQRAASRDKVELHDHVLELFIGLGDPAEQELDDALTDLLYFVVDILQFSGERNAYDEIDMDAVLVDILDALRAYHDRNSDNAVSTGHIILILDKELAAFPWEGLSCLQGQSVSRMPSLAAVMQRIRIIKMQQNQKACQDLNQPTSKEGYALQVRNGAYMLNPSSDLPSTEATMGAILQANLPSYTSTIRTPPTEECFATTLRDNDLFLYFGHGSGAQYIRGRTIRSLESCAVTLLMGCSSAKMTECGKFESYGMPGYYIGGTSGCMAVVGTLWDVTDRDIDRFALKTLVEWGLIEGDDEAVQTALDRSSRQKTVSATNGNNDNDNNNSSSSRLGDNLSTKSTAKGKGKEKTKAATVNINNSTIVQNRGNVALSQAVSTGRSACLLKYLNGAAPVVYGVPVFLA